MKYLLLALSIMWIFALTAFGQDIDKAPMITVSGTADVLVQPDEVVLTLNVSKKDMNLQVAKKQCDDAIAKILELARRFSVDPKNVRTDYISMDMKYESIRDPKAPRVYDEDGDEIGKKGVQRLRGIDNRNRAADKDLTIRRLLF